MGAFFVSDLRGPRGCAAECKAKTFGGQKQARAGGAFFYVLRVPHNAICVD